MFRISLLVFLLAASLFSCKKESNSPNTLSNTMKNVSYGPHGRNKMDIYLPADRNENDTKVFVWIHGGAWSGGDKSEFDNIKPVLDTTFENYAYISLNYRLFNANSNSNRFPAQEQDIQLALSFIQSKLSEWQVSDNIVLGGASAGGHLALLQAYKHNSEGLVKACVAYYPPTELVSYFPANLISVLVLNGVLNGNPDQKPEDYFNSSPVNFITEQSVPTIFFHGTADDVVPISQSELLQNKLEQFSVVHDYIYFQGAAHAFSNAQTKTSINRTRDFLLDLGL